MSIIYQTSGNRPLPLQDVEQPQLYRELFPYTSICRTVFDDVLLAPLSLTKGSSLFEKAVEAELIFRVGTKWKSWK